MFRRLLFSFGLLSALLSARGQNWYWSNPTPHGNAIIAVNYYAPGGLGIEACDNGQIYTSPDWVNWSSQNSQTTNSLQAITFLGSRIIITGQSGTVVYSDDGINFTYTNLHTSNWLVGAAASSNLALAVGDDAVVYASTNGSDWSLQTNTLPGVGQNWLLAAAYGNGTFAIVGAGGYLATSTNGSNWVQQHLTTGFSADVNDVKWISVPNAGNGFSSNSFIASCDNGAAYFSTNKGTSWTTYKLPGTSTNALYSSAGSASNRLVVGATSIYLGTNGNAGDSWKDQTDISINAAPEWTYYCATCLSNTYVVGGADGMLITGTPDPTNHGYDWAALDSSARDWLWHVTAISNILYVAVGDNARIMTSLDGVNWAVETVTNGLSVSLSNTVFFGVGGTTNLLLAVGTGGAMAYSLNDYEMVITTNADGSLSTNSVSDLGIVWVNLPALETSNDLHCVNVWGTNFFVSGGGGTIYCSGNPTNSASWTKMATPTTNYLSGLALFSNLMVCVGDKGTILTSSNGTTWTKQTSPTTNWIYSVRACGGSLIAVGENGSILTSSNGIEWLSRSSGTTNWLNDVQIVTNSYYIVGNYATVLTSTDTTNWSQVPINTDQSLYSAASFNGQLVTVGLGGTILRSQIVPDPNPLQFLDFGVASNQCVFYVATTDGNTDVNFTLDSSTDLVNWVTGPEVSITDDTGDVLFTIQLTNAPVTQFYRTTTVP